MCREITEEENATAVLGLSDFDPRRVRSACKVMNGIEHFGRVLDVSFEQPRRTNERTFDRRRQQQQQQQRPYLLRQEPYSRGLENRLSAYKLTKILPAVLSNVAHREAIAEAHHRTTTPKTMVITTVAHHRAIIRNQRES